MKIKVLTTFKEGRDSFEKDDQRTVSDEDGARFCANGWAEDMSGVVPTGDANGATIQLDVHSSTVGHTSTAIK